MSTTTILDRLEKEGATEEKFGPAFQEPFISTLLDHPEFFDLSHIAPTYFDGWAQLVVAHILNYWEQYNQVPTRELLLDFVAERMTEDEPWDDVFKLIKRPSCPREVPCIKDRYRDWVRGRVVQQLHSDEATQAVFEGDFQRLELIFDQIRKEIAVLDRTDEQELFGFTRADDLCNENLEYEFLIDGLMVAHQSMFVGGKKKVLKTGILCDLAISLSTGTKFLDEYLVPKPRRVAFFSSESGRLDIQNRLRTIRDAKGRQSLDDLFVSFERPQLSNTEHLARLSLYLQKREIEVLIIDPLYLTLLSGGDGNASSANVFDMGRVFSRIADICDEHGVTPVLCHHFKKTSTNKKPDLDDFAFTGAAEFARQSLLITRHGDYDPRNNQLRITYHGFGRGDTLSVVIDEGARPTENSEWNVVVDKFVPVDPVKNAEERDQQQLDKLQEYLRNHPQGVTRRDIQRDLKWNGMVTKRFVDLGIECGAMEEFRGRKTDSGKLQTLLREVGE